MKRKMFQNRKRATTIRELFSTPNKRKPIASQASDTKPVQNREIASLEKLKTSKFLKPEPSKIFIYILYFL